MYAIRSYYALLDLSCFNLILIYIRITSYNVCYTKLLRQETGLPTLTNFLIQNRSSKDIIVISSASEPVDLTDGVYIRPYERNNFV